jgi:hypothetical protein
MIYYVCTERFSTMIRRIIRGYEGRLGRILRLLSYEELFFERAGPIGHYIFTDFDRLTRYELDCAARFADALTRAAPAARVYNHPLRVLERYPLLLALHNAGINEFTAIRLEGDVRPPRYPVFIRAEDGYGGPETDLIHDDAGFVAALAELNHRGMARRGRIAIGYAAERGADGFFRKYSAARIGGAIVALHIQRNRNWVVKRNVRDDAATSGNFEADRLVAEAVAEELAYVRDNPHADVLERAFAAGGIDFGRADYGVVNGKVQVYEINTNPALPSEPKTNTRADIRSIVLDRLLAAFIVLDTPLEASGRLSFEEPRPRAHNLRLPRYRLPGSVARWLRDRAFRVRAKSD